MIAETEPGRLLFRLLLFASKSAPRRREILNGNTCPADDALLGGGEGDRLLLSSSSLLWCRWWQLLEGETSWWLCSDLGLIREPPPSLPVALQLRAPSTKLLVRLSSSAVALHRLSVSTLISWSSSSSVMMSRCSSISLSYVMTMAGHIECREGDCHHFFGRKKKKG